MEKVFLDTLILTSDELFEESLCNNVLTHVHTLIRFLTDISRESTYSSFDEALEEAETFLDISSHNVSGFDNLRTLLEHDENYAKSLNYVLAYFHVKAEHLILSMKFNSMEDMYELLAITKENKYRLAAYNHVSGLNEELIKNYLEDFNF